MNIEEVLQMSDKNMYKEKISLKNNASDRR